VFRLVIVLFGKGAVGVGQTRVVPYPPPPVLLAALLALATLRHRPTLVSGLAVFGLAGALLYELVELTFQALGFGQLLEG
jgi:hypothetical protein